MQLRHRLARTSLQSGIANIAFLRLHELAERLAAAALAAGISAARAIASAHRNGAPEVLCLQELHGMTRVPGRERIVGGSAPKDERSASPDGAGVA